MLVILVSYYEVNQLQHDVPVKVFTLEECGYIGMNEFFLYNKLYDIGE